MSLAVFALSLLLNGWSCETGTPGTPAQATPARLGGTAWTAVELAGMKVAAKSTAGNEPHLVFGNDGRVSGADACNRLTGTYTLKGDGITFGELAGTRMFCAESDEVVQRFHSALKGTSRWKIVAGRLEFYGATGKPLAVFEQRFSSTKPKV